MPDSLTKTQRSRCMSAIRGKDTKPELLLRKTLWHNGFRYRLKNKLLGTPDFVFATERVAVFVDGCFWHGCAEHFQKPETNAEFWQEKIRKNKERDDYVNGVLKSNGWDVLRFWEHEIKANPNACSERVIRRLIARRGRAE